MKKALFTLVALAATSAYAANVSSDDYKYTGSGSTLELSDVATFSQNGDFGLFFDMGLPLNEAGKVDFQLRFGEGKGGDGANISFSFDADARQYFDMATWQYIDAPYGVYTLSGNGGTTIAAFDTEITANKLLIQIKNLFEDNPLVSISVYDDNDILTEIATADIKPNANGNLPESISEMNVVLSTQSIPAIEDKGINITTWQGEVSADDIKNPSYLAPSPTVPEPATATLSLLALAGLAARRRRH